MLWKIQKSLGSVAAVQVDSIPTSGVCVEIKNYKQDDSSILIYQDGKLEDIQINGFIFPCVYNNLTKCIGCKHSDGSQYTYLMSFDFLDPKGSIHSIRDKKLYGDRESLIVEYFYTLIYYISCCDSTEQYEDLYKQIIDNHYLLYIKYQKSKLENALNVLNFIENFAPLLVNIKDHSFLQGLKQRLNIKFKQAQDIVYESDYPELSTY